MRWATMLKLDGRGKETGRCGVPYHSREWEILVESGWITWTVED